MQVRLLVAEIVDLRSARKQERKGTAKLQQQLKGEQELQKRLDQHVERVGCQNWNIKAVCCCGYQHVCSHMPQLNMLYWAINNDHLELHQARTCQTAATFSFWQYLFPLSCQPSRSQLPLPLPLPLHRCVS
jgi:hypothetical protein